MNDDASDHCPRQQDRINLANPVEVEYWTKKFGVNEHDLRNAIQVVGTSANKVSQQLKH